MKLFLIDPVNKDRDETVELPDNITYRELFHEIDDIIDKYKYSCLGYFVDQVNRENKVVVIRWGELFGDISKPFILLENCTNSLLTCLENEIR